MTRNPDHWFVFSLVPAKAGTQYWIPAFAGMSENPQPDHSRASGSLVSNRRIGWVPAFAGTSGV